eukprot:Sspe_Gene.54853::Locus_30227_Transcript_1_1_Confidence_1.000_Length_3363::g.54853::m.54853
MSVGAAELPRGANPLTPLNIGAVESAWEADVAQPSALTAEAPPPAPAANTGGLRGSSPPPRRRRKRKSQSQAPRVVYTNTHTTLKKPGTSLLSDISQWGAKLAKSDEAWELATAASFLGWCYTRSKAQTTEETNRAKWMKQHNITMEDLKRVLPTPRLEAGGAICAKKDFVTPDGHKVKKGMCGHWLGHHPSKPTMAFMLKMKGKKRHAKVEFRMEPELEYVEPVQHLVPWGWRSTLEESSSSDED